MRLILLIRLHLLRVFNRKADYVFFYSAKQFETIVNSRQMEEAFSEGRYKYHENFFKGKRYTMMDDVSNGIKNINFKDVKIVGVGSYSDIEIRHPDKNKINHVN